MSSTRKRVSPTRQSSQSSRAKRTCRVQVVFPQTSDLEAITVEVEKKNNSQPNPQDVRAEAERKTACQLKNTLRLTKIQDDVEYVMFARLKNEETGAQTSESQPAEAAQPLDIVDTAHQPIPRSHMNDKLMNHIQSYQTSIKPVPRGSIDRIHSYQTSANPNSSLISSTIAGFGFQTGRNALPPEQRLEVARTTIYTAYANLVPGSSSADGNQTEVYCANASVPAPNKSLPFDAPLFLSLFGPKNFALNSTLNGQLSFGDTHSFDPDVAAVLKQFVVPSAEDTPVEDLTEQQREIRTQFFSYFEEKLASFQPGDLENFETLGPVLKKAMAKLLQWKQDHDHQKKIDEKIDGLSKQSTEIDGLVKQSTEKIDGLFQLVTHLVAQLPNLPPSIAPALSKEAMSSPVIDDFLSSDLEPHTTSNTSRDSNLGVTHSSHPSHSQLSVEIDQCEFSSLEDSRLGDTIETSLTDPGFSSTFQQSYSSTNSMRNSVVKNAVDFKIGDDNKYVVTN